MDISRIRRVRHALIYALLCIASVIGASAALAEQARHDFPYESSFVDILGSQMHYVDTGGNGDPILLVHGQPTWSYLWRKIIPLLDGDRRVIALDLIGFGKSDQPQIAYSAEDHARYFAAFLDALEIEQSVLVG